jgi:DNA recombination protein Rad52
MGEAALSISVASSSGDESASVGDRLDRFLGPEFISKRPGPGGVKLAYIEGHRLISLANAIFGYNGWSTAIRGRVVDFVERGSDGKWSVGVNVIMRVTLSERHGSIFHEDVGYGTAESMKDRGSATEKAGKEAATDAIKRALRQFGDAMGNCLYNKDYLKRVALIKSGFEVIDFDEDRLHRLKVNESRKRRRTDGDGLGAMQCDLPFANGGGVKSNGVSSGDEEFLDIAFEDDELLGSFR